MKNFTSKKHFNERWGIIEIVLNYKLTQFTNGDANITVAHENNHIWIYRGDRYSQSNTKRNLRISFGFTYFSSYEEFESFLRQTYGYG